MDVAQRRSRPAKKSTKRTAGARPRGGARKTPARRGAGRPVVHWEINARDPKTLHGFYSELFGWKINADNPMGPGPNDTGLSRRHVLAARRPGACASRMAAAPGARAYAWACGDVAELAVHG